MNYTEAAIAGYEATIREAQDALDALKQGRLVWFPPEPDEYIDPYSNEVEPAAAPVELSAQHVPVPIVKRSTRVPRQQAKAQAVASVLKRQKQATLTLKDGLIANLPKPRRTMSAAGRKAISEAQKRRHAKARKAKG
jgi:hypothetical protein